MNRPEEEMDEFERELARSMRRVDAPEWFAARVMERAAAVSNVRVMPRRGPVARMWVGGAIAAALVAGVFVGEQAHERSEQRKAVVVQQQFETAMRVTDHALDQTRAKLQRVGLNFGE